MSFNFNIQGFMKTVVITLLVLALLAFCNEARKGHWDTDTEPQPATTSR